MNETAVAAQGRVTPVPVPSQLLLVSYRVKIDANPSPNPTISIATRRCWASITGALRPAGLKGGLERAPGRGGCRRPGRGGGRVRSHKQEMGNKEENQKQLLKRAVLEFGFDSFLLFVVSLVFVCGLPFLLFV